MPTSQQELATVAKDQRAPVWISVVSGLTGQAPLNREHAHQRLIALLKLTSLLIGIVGATVVLTEILR